VEDLRRACKGQVLFRSGLCRKLTAMRFHQIDAAGHVPDLASESPLNTSWVFLERLHEAGWRAAEEWLQAQGE
jgi:hypothetical protein